MMQPLQPPPRSPSAGGQSAANPFRSERLRPGVVPYLFSDGRTIEGLLGRLQQSRWRGEIIGPHGTGKSTLIHALLPRLTAQGFSVLHGSFSGGKQQWSELPSEKIDSQNDARTPRIVVIDGFEQLSTPARWKWNWMTYLRGHGLVVTAHHSMGLPALQQTNVPADLAQEIARQIAGNDLGGLTAEDVISALQSQSGNMRDAMFALYDQIEARRPQAS